MNRTDRKCNLLYRSSVGYHDLLWFLMGLSMLFTVYPREAESAELRILPSLTVSEEYNDNVFLTANNKLDDYITLLSPALHLTYGTSFWDWDVRYAYDYRYYARGTRDEDSTQEADFRLNLKPVKEIVFLDIRDEYRRVSLSTLTDYTQQSSFVNQSDRNVFTVNPYIVMASGSLLTPILGYMYVNTWYKEPQALDRYDNIGYFEIKADLSTKMTFSTGVRYTQDQNDIDAYKMIDVYAGPKYTYAYNSYLYVYLGESWIDFTVQEDNKHVIWNAGFTHKYSTVTVAFDTRSSYQQEAERILRRVDSYVATLTKETVRTSYEVSGGLWEYRRASTDHLEDTVYGITGRFNHAITQETSIHLNLSIQRIEDNLLNTYNSVYVSGVRFAHTLRENLTAAAEYQHTNSYSPDLYYQNYVNNRIFVELRMIF